MRKIYKQKGPTCAIYAFLNGCFYDEQFSQRKIDCIAFRLIQEATQRNSVIGEFFASGELAKFLSFQQEISVKKIEKIVDLSMCKLKKNEFLLIPISVGREFGNKRLNGMHWICVLERSKKIYVIDSETKKINEIKDLFGFIQARQNFKDKSFDWQLWTKCFTWSIGDFLFYKKIFGPYYIRKYSIGCLQRIKKIQSEDLIVKMVDVRLLKITI